MQGSGNFVITGIVYPVPGTCVLFACPSSPVYVLRSFHKWLYVAHVWIGLDGLRQASRSARGTYTLTWVTRGTNRTRLHNL